jgi:site-specific DNA-methyltransferase (cytosine-N4-specific)
VRRVGILPVLLQVGLDVFPAVSHGHGPLLRVERLRRTVAFSPSRRRWRHAADGTNQDVIGRRLARRRNPDTRPVTSPPYWSLRDYDVDGQIGRNERLPEFIKSLVTIFDEVRRVLRDDGTLWVNIGDAYTSGNRTWRAPDKKNPARAMSVRPSTPEGLKPKDLIGVPWRFAIAMQDAGWYLRSDIIWYKPNCQPESVRDRPTRSHEHVLLFSKSERYTYNTAAVQGPNGRRLRDVWEMNTVGFPGAHFATFPPELVRRCVAIGSEKGDLVLDPFAGSGTTLAVAAANQRRFLGCELNPDYVPLIKDRVRQHKALAHSLEPSF